MPRPLSNEARTMVTAMLETKEAYVNIAVAANCSIAQVKKMAKNKKHWNTVVAPKLARQGRPMILTRYHVEVCPDPFYFVILRSYFAKLIPVTATSRISF